MIHVDFCFIQVENDEDQDEISYGKPPLTEFQRFIRLGRDGKIIFSFLNFCNSGLIYYT